MVNKQLLSSKTKPDKLYENRYSDRDMHIMYKILFLKILNVAYLKNIHQNLLINKS